MVNLELREYQHRAVTMIREALRSGKRRIVLAMPTGAGKSAVAQHIIESARAKGTKVLFVVNRVQLVNQFSRRLHAAKIQHGIIQAARTRHIDAGVLVASIATVARRGVPDDIGLVIIDEAHGVPGTKAYVSLLKALKVPSIGLTATPFARGMSRHHDDLGGKLFEDIVVPVTIRDLIESGNLVDIEAWAPESPDLSKVKIGADGDYVESQLDGVVNTKRLVGGIVEHWMRLAKGQSTVVFASSIAHSQNIVEAFKLAGVMAEHVDAYTKDDDRQEILERLERGVTKVVSNCAVLAEGFDEPRISCMVLARPTRSLTRMMQMAGRVLRPYEGKDKALVLDHSGSLHRFPWLTDPMPMELDDGRAKESSGSQATDEDAEKLARNCPVCNFVKRPGVWTCPRCGHTPKRPDKVETIPGALTKLERKTAKLEDKQAVWSMLTMIRRERGYTRGWASHKYKEYFGVWPVRVQDRAEPPTPEFRSWIKSRNIAYAKSLERKMTEGRNRA